MLAIGGIGTATVAPRAARRGPDAASATDVSVAEARALIPVTAPAPSSRPAAATRRPLAAFLAHLIATQSQAPQTRTRRRAEPEDVNGVYAAATKPRSINRSRFDCRA